MPNEPIPRGSAERQRVRIFESYGRRDASKLAERLRQDLEAHNYSVWQDIERLHGGAIWDERIREALRNSEAVVAILSPHATRSGPESPDQLDSVCLDEIAFARFGDPPRPIVPVMAVACDPPLTIYRLHCIDMQGWEESAQQYQTAFKELVEAIDLALAGKPALRRFVLSLNPDERLAAILDRRRQDFTGRDWLFAKIESWRERDERMLLITGDPGAGKSALVAELVHRNPQGQVLAYHCCISALPDTLSAGGFVRNIAAMLASQLPAYAKAIERGGMLELLTDAERDPVGAFEFGVIAPLASLTPPDGPPRYVLIDALDEGLVGDSGSPITIPDLLTSRLGALPAWLRVLATSRHRRAVIEPFGAVRELVLDVHDERNLADIREYLDHRLREQQAELGLKLESSREAAVERLCRLADGSFVYAKYAVNALALGKLSLDNLERQPPGLATLYEESFALAFAEPGSFEPCAELLAVVLAARRPLRREQLVSILRIASVEFERRLAPLEPYLARIEGAYSLFHKSIGEWLTNPEVGTTTYHVDRAQGEPALLAWCRRWRKSDDEYALRYLPTHLAAAKATDELLGLLLDPAFGSRRRAAGIRPLFDVDDYAALTSLLLDAGRADDLAELARTTSSYRRDGVALALRTAEDRNDERVRAAVERLLSLGPRRRRAELPPDVLSARIIAIDTASQRGYCDALIAAANDPSPAVRAVVVPHMYRFWDSQDGHRWELFDGLGQQLFGALRLPRQSQIEVTGGLSLAILSRDFEDEATVARLSGFWRETVRRALASPLAHAARNRIVLRLGIGALRKVMRDQPEYQPLNLLELSHTFGGAGDHAEAVVALAALEHPEQGLGSVVEVLGDQALRFDVFLMTVAERALVLHGARNPAEAISSIERIYQDGAPWFHQSCLYSAFHALYTADAPEPRWLDRYRELTDQFVTADRASLRTEVGAYRFAPHLAWAEVVFARHQPTGRARFLNRFFQDAQEHGDDALAETVIEACHLLSLAYRQSQLSLDALRDIVPRVPADSPLEERLVQALANIRLYEDASVDRFLRGLGHDELANRIVAATPSVRANEFPTWMDGFVNHLLVSSEEFRAELCGAFRRAAGVRNVSELLYDNVLWVLGMLGERVY